MRAKADAIAWGRAQITKRSQDWTRWCLVFVRSCFGIAALWPDAGTAWDNAKHKHRTTNPDEIPAGAPVFWELASVADHVALSTGRGMCLSNDIRRPGHIAEVPIDEITRRWGGTLLGWTEDLNGVRVYTPPPTPKTRGKWVDATLKEAQRRAQLNEAAGRPKRAARLRAVAKALRQIPAK